MVQQWEVVGGADKGGIMVRDGKATSSRQLPDKLATGAVVQEVELAGDRLHYKKISGSGPDEGWVSTVVKDKPLLTKVAAAAPDAKAAGADPKPAAAKAPAPAAAAPASGAADAGVDLSQDTAAPPPELAGAQVYDHTQEELEKAIKEADDYWMSPDRKEVRPADTTILTDFLNRPLQVGAQEPGDYKGGQLPVMPRTVGLPTYNVVPDHVKKNFPERPVRKPMIRLYCFPGAADNYMLWIEMATAAPDWCEVAIYEPRAHGFRPNEPWDKTLEERADDCFRVMRPAFETHSRGGVSEGAPFGFLSHGVGGQFMALLAQRLKRELQIEPLVVFANDGPPSNVPTLSDEGYKLLCSDIYKFYQIFQSGTIQQVERLGGKDSKQGSALLQKWARGFRMFEEHSMRAEKLDEPVFHKFNCDLHVLVARHTVDMHQAMDAWPKEVKKEMEARRKVIRSTCHANWDRAQFKKWEEWTTEDFYYHEVETDHMSIKNHKLMRDIVFKELAGFCGMDYRP